MTLKQEVNMLRTEVKEMRQLQLQQTKLTEELSIIIKGSQSLGVVGIREHQRRDELFRERMFSEFIDFNKKLDDNTQVIMTQVDKRVKEIEIGLSEVKEWKSTWNKAIALISSSTTWRLLFFVGLGIAGVIIFVKFKILGMLITK